MGQKKVPKKMCGAILFWRIWRYKNRKKVSFGFVLIDNQYYVSLNK
jgi:hypothetical protein